jgi:hypothetical protein
MLGASDQLRRLTMTTMTARDEYLETLKARCDQAPYKAAVCDMLGRCYQGPTGQTRFVKEDSDLRDRYEVRSKAHVEVYGFKTLYTNYGE